MKRVGDEDGLVTVSEVMSGDTVLLVAQYVDILQIGARSMQNFPLLIEAATEKRKADIPKEVAQRNHIDEFLLAAEYVLNYGNKNVILCERGIVPLDRSYAQHPWISLRCPF